MNDGFTGETRAVPFEGVTFRVDAADPSRPAWFALGVRKSGSSMFNRAVKLLAKFNAVNWIDLAGDLFDNDVPFFRWREGEVPPALIVGGNCYGGFRDCPTGLTRHPEFTRGLKVLLVRDPRDAIVSEYFSTAHTHRMPGAGVQAEGGASDDMLRKRETAQAQSVEDYVLAEGGRLGEAVERYIPLLGDPKLLVLRYEDIIFDKARMVRDIAQHFGWGVTLGQVDAVLKWIDVRPEVEDPTKFIRKVTPGDHREKLSAPVIAKLNQLLGGGMEAFGYR